MMSTAIEGPPTQRYGEDSTVSFFPEGAVSSFQGKTRVYKVETYRSGSNKSFVEIPESSPLVAAIQAVYLDTYPRRNKEVSIERVKQSLSYPRTILQLVLHEGVPVGYGLFPRFIIDGEPVLYSSRAFLPEHEGQGLGTHVLREGGIRLHQEELTKAHRRANWLVLLTQNPLSVFTLEKSNIAEEIFPLHKPYDLNREAQTVMLRVYPLVRLRSRSINAVTGVSAGELTELGMNETWRPRSDQGRVYEIFQQMVSYAPAGLGMNREAGDEVYVTARLKKPVIVTSEGNGSKAA